MSSLAQRALRRVSMKTESSVDRNDWYQTRWIRAATDAGWHVHWQDGQFLEFDRNGQRMRVARSDAGLDSNLTFRILADKARTSRLLGTVGVPTPRSERFDVTQARKLFTAVEAHDGEAVVKPSVGTGGGAGITVGPSGRRSIADAIKEAAMFGRSIAVDERVHGRVLRVLVLDGIVCDSVHRQAAHVIGDGRSTVAALIDEENARRSRLGDASTGFIVTGADHRAALRRAKMSRTSVLPSDERVAVAGITNSGSERESTCIAISTATEDMAISAANVLGVRLAGVDLVIDELDQPLAVLEVNTAPGLHWHELVAGEPFDAFAAIINGLGGP